MDLRQFHRNCACFAFRIGLVQDSVNRQVLNTVGDVVNTAPLACYKRIQYLERYRLHFAGHNRPQKLLLIRSGTGRIGQRTLKLAVRVKHRREAEKLVRNLPGIGPCSFEHRCKLFPHLMVSC